MYIYIFIQVASTDHENHSLKDAMHDANLRTRNAIDICERIHMYLFIFLYVYMCICIYI